MSGIQLADRNKDHKCYSETDGFVHLQAHVATSAFDADHKLDAPACHPNTRVAVQDEIMEWILGAIDRIYWILWLNGAAGAGKSAIGRSIVERCVQNNIPIARFFFFRTDSTRNNVKPIVATLVYQIIQIFPDLKAPIVSKISADPLVFTLSLETQFERLIFDPLRNLKEQLNDIPTLVFLFDGVDECIDKDDQHTLITILTRFVKSHHFPLIVFFGSRPEPQFTMEFNAPHFKGLLLRLALDHHYLPDADIRLFLDDSFRKIKETHRLRAEFEDDWPAPEHVKEIVEKSSGQFIYASVVVKFISFPSSNPCTRLEIVRGLSPAGRLTPFAQLDFLYHHIFDQIQDPDATLPLLACLVLCPGFSKQGLAGFSKMTVHAVGEAFADLTSVIEVAGTRIEFLHASLPDFLVDTLRSGKYCVTTPRWSTHLSIMWFRQDLGFRFSSVLNRFLLYAEPSTELRTYILNFVPSEFYEASGISQYLTRVKHMDFGDGQGGSVYKQQLASWTRYYYTNNQVLNIEKHHDISGILQEIMLEKVRLCTSHFETPPQFGSPNMVKFPSAPVNIISHITQLIAVTQDHDMTTMTIEGNFCGMLQFPASSEGTDTSMPILLCKVHTVFMLLSAPARKNK